MQNVAEKYDKMRYSSERGALTFYNDIKCRAARMVQPPNEYSVWRKFINGLPMSIAEGVVKSLGISAEHLPMEQILVEVQRMESALKMISSYSWAQQVKSSHKSSSVDDRTKDRPGSGNSDRGSKYFCRGNVLYKKALSNARQQREGGQRPQGSRDTGCTNNSKGKGRATTFSRKGAGCFNCGENGHFVDRCPKPKKQDKARLFAAEVQDTDTNGEQDEQDNAAQDIDKPGPSPSSDDDEDQVNGPQYLSDDEDIIEIYDDDDNSDREPVACLGRMSTHDPSDEEVVCYSYMSIAEDDSDEFSEFEGDDKCEDLLNEYEVHCVVLKTGNLGSHEQSCNGDVSITDLLKVPALGQELEHFNAPQETAEEVTAEGISSWGVINVMEKFAMPEINASPRWDWSDHFGFTHCGECQPCRLYQRR